MIGACKHFVHRGTWKTCCSSQTGTSYLPNAKYVVCSAWSTPGIGALVGRTPRATLAVAVIAGAHYQSPSLIGITVLCHAVQHQGIMDVANRWQYILQSSIWRVLIIKGCLTYFWMSFVVRSPRHKSPWMGSQGWWLIGKPG